MQNLLRTNPSVLFTGKNYRLGRRRGTITLPKLEHHDVPDKSAVEITLLRVMLAQYFL